MRQQLNTDNQHLTLFHVYMNDFTPNILIKMHSLK